MVADITGLRARWITGNKVRGITENRVRVAVKSFGSRTGNMAGSNRGIRVRKITGIQSGRKAGLGI